ncbi:ABC protein [Clavulina sp. PMI_390]|nr:ABC protein [Clavulina sp. PMI_390]
MQSTTTKEKIDDMEGGPSQNDSAKDDSEVLGGSARRWRWLLSPPRPPHSSLDDAPEIPVATAPLWSLLTFSWVFEIMMIGWKRPLQADDLWRMDASRQASLLSAKLQASWTQHVEAAKEWNAKLDSGAARPHYIRRAWWFVRTRGNAARREQRLQAWKLKSRAKASLMMTLIDTFGFQFWLGGFLKLTNDIAQLGAPLVSKASFTVIITEAQKRAVAKLEGTPVPGVGRGIGAAVGLFLLLLVASVCQHQWYWRSMSLGVASRSALTNWLLARGLTFTPHSRILHPNGSMVNHVSTDISRVDYFFQWCHPAWTAPVTIVVCLALLITEIGVSALAGFAIFVFSVPVQLYAMRQLLKVRKKSMKFTDRRAGLLQEILGAMKIVKLFTYEGSFWQRINEIRHDELKGIRTLLIIRSATQAVAFTLPILASVVAFVVYAALGHKLEPATIFTSLAYFNLLRAPLMTLPRALSSIVDGQNALGRMTSVFEAECLDNDVVQQDEDLKVALSVNDASFQWERFSSPTKEPAKKASKSKPTTKKASSAPSDPKETSSEPFSLQSINFSIPRGGAVHAIVGRIGSGKSSVLYGIIGEMRRTSGSVQIGGTTAYCAQTPWIQNASLRDNITFGREFVAEKYWRIISEACLEPDLDLLPDRDLTEIGEKGINLSGGQKARVNLARVLYSEADVVLLDDPLSAVDAHVAERLFNDAILSLKARGTAVLLVTHALHFLPFVDHVYCMNDGTIQEEGSYQELVNSQGPFSELVKDFGHVDAKKEEEGEEEEGNADPGITEKAKSTTMGTKSSPKVLMQKETRRTGQVKSDVYKSYFVSGGGIPVFILVFGCIVITQGAQVVGSYWLVWWQEYQFGGSNGLYMAGYAGLGLAQALGTFASGAALSFMSNLASANMHGNAFETALHAPMSFFDTTPLGRIIGIFGKDMDTIDNTLSDSIRMAVLIISALIASVILLSIIVWYFLFIISVILFGYTLLAIFYTSSSRELKRLDGILRSFLYAHFAESLSGVATIRAYNVSARFLKDNGRYIDRENAALYLFTATQRWMSIRLDFLGALLTLSVALVSVFGANGISPAKTGLLLTEIVGISQFLGMMIRQTAEVENNMNAVERVYQYSNERTIPQEASYDDSPDTISPDPTWPSVGKIEFKNVTMSYREGLSAVLHGLSLDINGGEKIGVVGRTGAGKSTLMAILFRLIELSSGSISIDGVDISKLGLKRLRSGLSIIPQEALLFSGTVRSNLDPFGEHDDAELWDALRRAHVGASLSPTGPASTVAPNHPSRTFTLDTAIEAEGANLSVGQRSLLSLARALCKNSQIVLMDEATASVDVETDHNIQETILREFKDKTLICIAHRLRTIINYQRIVVMDKGDVAEFDAPLNLFDREDGIFRSMCETSHITRDDIVAAAKAAPWSTTTPGAAITSSSSATD